MVKLHAIIHQYIFPTKLCYRSLPLGKKFKQYPIGYIHIDIAEVRTEEGKLQLFVAIDRTCKFAYVDLHQDKNKITAAQFLRNFIEIIPYKIHTILTESEA